MTADLSDEIQLALPKFCRLVIGEESVVRRNDAAQRSKVVEHHPTGNQKGWIGEFERLRLGGEWSVIDPKRLRRTTCASAVVLRKNGRRVARSNAHHRVTDGSEARSGDDPRGIELSRELQAERGDGVLLREEREQA